jgi:iron complex transport system ATP-binding protein
MGGMKSEDYEAVNDALDAMGITDLANREVDELSGGQRQRVWIAMALAQQTDILFLDEPTTFLDVTHQIEILDLLRELNQKNGTTIVMVLHDINLSARYSDHMIALKDGQLIAEGDPCDIVDEGLISTVFNLDCEVINDPVSNTPLIIPKGKYQRKQVNI